MDLTILGYALGLAVAVIGWFRWQRELRERRLAALAGARRGLSLHEFVRDVAADGVDGIVATCVYLTIRDRAKLGEHRLHPNDALTAYFDDGDAVIELGRDLMLTLDRSSAATDIDTIASTWRSVSDVTDWFGGRGTTTRPNPQRPNHLRTIQ